MNEYASVDIELLSDKVPGLILWKKNAASVYTDCNIACAKLFGLKNSQDVVGLTDFDLHSDLSEDAEYCVLSDQDVMQNKISRKLIRMYQFHHGEQQALLVNKVPVLNQDGNSTGTVAYCKDITMALRGLNNILLSNEVKLNTKSKFVANRYAVGSYVANIQLSERQIECLFFLLRGKTAKETARLLLLSSRTVEAYFEQLKVKFSASTKGELITKAIERGYMNLIPQRIFETQLLLVLE